MLPCYQKALRHLLNRVRGDTLQVASRLYLRPGEYGGGGHLAVMHVLVADFTGQMKMLLYNTAQRPASYTVNWFHNSLRYSKTTNVQDPCISAYLLCIYFNGQTVAYFKMPILQECKSYL